VNQSQWRVVASSVRGTSHEQTGMPCQDFHQWAALSETLLVAAVADGAGSAAQAELGAATAAVAAVDFLRTCFSDSAPAATDDAAWLELVTESVASAKEAVAGEAKRRLIEISQLASTLIVVVAGTGFVAAVQVGDGAVVIAQADGKLVSLTRPAQSEYLNETVFLTSTEALDTVQSAVWRGEIAHLAVLSDGLQMAALHMPDGEPHPGFFCPLFNFFCKNDAGKSAQEALAAFLASPKMRSRTDDDVTLVIGSLKA